MSDLHTLQLQLTKAMLAYTQPHLDELRDDDVCDARSRFAIYHQGYRIRLRDALRAEFPGLVLMTGARFVTLVDSYIDAHPSHHFNIRWHGKELAAFLGDVTPWRDHPELSEMAQLDWAISTAFDAADESPLNTTDLAQLPPEGWSELRLHPLKHLRILTTTCNVDVFRRAADRGQRRPSLRRLRQSRHLMIWRPAWDVRYRAVEADELQALDGMLLGEPFAQLCERMTAQQSTTTSLPRMVTLLSRWLSEGLVGRLTVPDVAPM
ncbi:HvfC/BufC family peptide modification chaperone [Dyella sp. 20L07]|uniref:HvfC/BufC family peptide modification chaperone n=1 Tax=Dyella sp. 20L07 TaxID=3384240 RepID=UPI003D270620